MHVLVDGLYGINVPLRFAQNYDLNQWGISQENQQILLDGHDHPEYWEVWNEVLETARFEKNGKEFRLYQDDDLVVEEMER